MPSIRTTCLALAALFLLPSASFGDPPDHAPAWGRRNKEQQRHHETKVQRPRNGVEIVFDSEKGVHVAIGLPGVYFEAGHYFRYADAGWQMSATGKDGWRVSAVSSVPDPVRAMHPSPPAKASPVHKPRGRYRFGKKHD